MCEDSKIQETCNKGYPTQEYCPGCGEALEGDAKVCDDCRDGHENEMDDVAEDEINDNR